MKEKPGDKATSIRVRSSTRDRLNAMAEKGGLTPEGLILSLMKRDNTKQVLLTMDTAKWYSMHDLAKWLHRNGYTKSERLDDMLMWALDATVTGIQSRMEGIHGPSRQSTANGNMGQPRGVHTI